MKHTPGPWTVAGPSANQGESFVIESPENTIAWTSDTWDEDGDRAIVTEEDRANARLIAAAPELLCALTSIYRDVVEDFTTGKHVKTPDLDAWLMATSRLLRRLEATS